MSLTRTGLYHPPQLTRRKTTSSLYGRWSGAITKPLISSSILGTSHCIPYECALYAMWEKRLALVLLTALAVLCSIRVARAYWAGEARISPGPRELRSRVKMPKYTVASEGMCVGSTFLSQEEAL